MPLWRPRNNLHLFPVQNRHPRTHPPLEYSPTAVSMPCHSMGLPLRTAGLTHCSTYLSTCPSKRFSALHRTLCVPGACSHEPSAASHPLQCPSSIVAPHFPVLSVGVPLCVVGGEVTLLSLGAVSVLPPNQDSPLVPHQQLPGPPKSPVGLSIPGR